MLTITDKGGMGVRQLLTITDKGGSCIWYKQWKSLSGCLEKFALGNFQGSSGIIRNLRGQTFQTTTEDFPLFVKVLD